MIDLTELRIYDTLTITNSQILLLLSHLFQFGSKFIILLIIFTDSGVVERDEVFHLGSSFLCHISTQTPKCSSSFKATNQESTDAPTPADSAKRAWSR